MGDRCTYPDDRSNRPGGCLHALSWRYLQRRPGHPLLEEQRSHRQRNVSNVLWKFPRRSRSGVAPALTDLAPDTDGIRTGGLDPALGPGHRVQTLSDLIILLLRRPRYRARRTL